MGIILRLLTAPVLIAIGAIIEHYRPLGTRWHSENAVKTARAMAVMDAERRCCHD